MKSPQNFQEHFRAILLLPSTKWQLKLLPVLVYITDFEFSYLMSYWNTFLTVYLQPLVIFSDFHSQQLDIFAKMWKIGRYLKFTALPF